MDKYGCMDKLMGQWLKILLRGWILMNGYLWILMNGYEWASGLRCC